MELQPGVEVRQPEASGRDQLMRPPVTDNQVSLLFEALEAGSTVVDAAKAAGIGRYTAHRVLGRYRENLAGVTKLLALKAYDAAEDWIKASAIAADKGDHKPAKELLQTIGAVQVIGDSSSTGVTINIGTPDAPIAISAQIQDLSPTLKR